MKDTVIPPLPASQRKYIKNVVKLRYGMDAEDKDIDWIDDLLRSQYSVDHLNNIINKIVTVNIDKILLKHRDKIESAKFERLGFEKLIFRYLTYASMSYRAGIPICSIFLCRTALEVGLRERVAEELAKEEIQDIDKLPQKIWEQMEKLKDKKLWKLMEIADKKGIITKDEIEEFFKPLKLSEYNSRRALDKFIHGDIGWIVEFVENKDKEHATVIGAKDILHEKKILAEVHIDDMAVITLLGTTLVAEKLYLRA